MTSRTHSRAQSRALLTGLILTLALSLSPGVATGRIEPIPAVEQARDPAQQLICNPRYPYAGCTWRQIKSLEVGTKKRISKHFVKFRWGQSRNEWSILEGHPKVNRKLRRLYNDAMDRWQRHQVQAAKARGVTLTRLPQPAYPTWAAFKAGSNCDLKWWMEQTIGSFCTTARIMHNHWDSIFSVLQRIVRISLYCTGALMIAEAAEGAKKANRKMSVSTKKILRFGARGPTPLGITACAATFMLSEVFL